MTQIPKTPSVCGDITTTRKLQSIGGLGVAALLPCVALACSAFAGPPVWPRFVVDNQLRGADGARLADANGDGRLDIVTGWEESGRTRIYLHPGPRGVRKRWPAVDLGRTPSVEDACWVDLDGDGNLDVLSSCEGNEQTLHAFFAPPASEQTQPDRWRHEVVPASRGQARWMYAAAPPSTATQLRGWLAVGSKQPAGQIGLLQFQGPIARWRIVALAPADWIMTIRWCDVDRDGDLDLIYSDRKGKKSGVYWLENHLSAGDDPGEVQHWTRHLIGAAGSEVMFLDVHDGVAGEHWPSGSSRVTPPEKSRMPTAGRPTDTRQNAPLVIYAAVRPDRIVRLQPSADCRRPWDAQHWTVSGHDMPIGTMKSVRAVDVDNDGSLEIVVSCEHATPPRRGLYYVELQGDRVTRVVDVSGPEGIKFDLLQVFDVDEDGDVDILTCEERAGGTGLGVIWYANPHVSQ